MTGLRRRVSVGFLSIAVLLSISGVIAFFELNTLSHDTKNILNINNRKMDLAHQMLSTIQEQDAAFVQMTLFNDTSADSIFIKQIDKLSATLEIASNETSNPRQLDSIAFRISELRLLAHTIISPPEFDTIAVASRASHYDSYLPIQAEIVNSIYDFTTSSFKAMEPRAEQLQLNAYRAVTPVFISLVVMIVIVLMLYYFMIIYCVNPIVRLNRSLGDFITYRLPFISKDDCGDEVKELQEKIELITVQIRRDSTK